MRYTYLMGNPPAWDLPEQAPVFDIHRGGLN